MLYRDLFNETKKDIDILLDKCRLEVAKKRLIVKMVEVKMIYEELKLAKRQLEDLLNQKV